MHRTAIDQIADRATNPIWKVVLAERSCACDPVLVSADRAKTAMQRFLANWEHGTMTLDPESYQEYENEEGQPEAQAKARHEGHTYQIYATREIVLY